MHLSATHACPDMRQAVLRPVFTFEGSVDLEGDATKAPQRNTGLAGVSKCLSHRFDASEAVKMRTGTRGISRLNRAFRTTMDVLGRGAASSSTTTMTQHGGAEVHRK